MFLSTEKIQHIILFKGRIKILNSKIDRFIKYLNSRKIDYYLVDTNDESTYSSERFDNYILQDGCAMFTYNNVGINLFVNQNENLWKKLNIPVFTYLEDPPSTFRKDFSNPSCDLNVICCDKNHVKFIKYFYPKVKDAFFITQGGSRSDNSIPLAERPIDVIYMGSQTSFHGFPAISFLSDNGSDLYSYCVNCLFSDNSKTAHEAIKEYLSEKNIELSDSDFFELNHDCADSITNYVRREYKFLGMHALDQAGIHVDVYGGDSWVDSENSYSPNIKLHERVDIEELLKKASQSKISLCFVPWFKKGCSEKNFDSMLNGALCVSDRSEYLNEHYQDGKNIIYFDLNNPAQMAADIKWLLEHIDAAEQIAQKGYETALKYDSADIMYEKIYNLMNEVN